MNKQIRAFSLQSEAPETPQILDKLDDRSRQLIEKFLRETYHDQLIKQPEVKSALLRWLSRGEYSNASVPTKRQDLARLKVASSENEQELGDLVGPLEDLIADKRNAVANTAQKSARARMVNQDFLRGIQTSVNIGDATDVEIQAYVMFVGTIMTGLRPGEWATAVVERSKFIPEEGQALPVMVVKTGKVKAHEEERYRTLILDEFKDEQIQMLEECIRIAQQRDTPQSLGALSRALRKIACATTDRALHQEALDTLCIKEGRKIYTVEARRAKRSKKAVAAALGHTTIINQRSYDSGDLNREREISLPLARAPKGAIEAVRDTLREFKDNNYKTVRRKLAEDFLDN